MPKAKCKIHMFKKRYLVVAGVLLLALLASFLLWFNYITSWQSEQALVAGVEFEGEYSINGGEWKPIVKGEHIPSDKGDVILRGNFYMFAPDGERVGVYREDMPVALYTDHIALTITEGEHIREYLDMENPEFGSSNCGERWNAYLLLSDPDQTVQILIHNPHRIGNETAIDQMLDKMAIWSGIEFEKEAMNSGDAQRNVGIVILLISVLFFGVAIFSSLIHVKNSIIVWLLGLVVLFAGLYVTYSAEGISFWSESVSANTTILGFSMMFYMLFVSMVIVYFLKSTKMVGGISVLVLALSNAIFFILPIISNVLFYDTIAVWVLVQIVGNVMLSVCLFMEFFKSRTKIKWIYIGAFLPLVAFCVDVVGTKMAIWKGGVVSQYVFIGLLVVAIIMILKLIPHNINAAAKAKELEMERIALNAELAESRISTMMSQIRPHFIYNTLGSIEQLCEIDPQKAGELVHDFAKYLRGNFGELDNPKPILMSKEMEHVRHYVSIENVRFPDMTFSFDMNSDDFEIPALTVQPIVENAIKHGLMRLQKGGTIHVTSYQTDEYYFVSVTDDGVGFDTTLLIDERQHVGLRNIRERLKAMVNGTLEIESTVGVGTKVLIKIPKEVRK